MSKILVVEPYRMLQHAIGLYLFPQHQAHMASSMPDLHAIKDFDAAIIDAAALRETGGVSGAAFDSLQSSGVPILWIDTLDSPTTPVGDHVAVVHTPIAKQSLERALAQCLGHLQEGGESATRQALSSDDTGRGGKAGVIDLVDIVEVVEQAADKGQDKNEPERF